MHPLHKTVRYPSTRQMTASISDVRLMREVLADALLRKRGARQLGLRAANAADLDTLVCARGPNFPLSRLESRLMCPACLPRAQHRGLRKAPGVVNAGRGWGGPSRTPTPPSGGQQGPPAPIGAAMVACAPPCLSVCPGTI
jgi:alkylation response protein AidB-like acyl-CoA dehydrogenase